MRPESPLLLCRARRESQTSKRWLLWLKHVGSPPRLFSADLVPMALDFTHSYRMGGPKRQCDEKEKNGAAAVQTGHW